MTTNFEILKNCLIKGNEKEAANLLVGLCTAFHDCNSCDRCINRISNWGHLPASVKNMGDVKNELVMLISEIKNLITVAEENFSVSDAEKITEKKENR